MGQKVHPVGFRLGVIKKHKALWYAKGKSYKENLIEDLKVRDFIKDRLRFSSISKVDLERSAQNFVVNIHTSRPGIIIGKKGEEIESLKKDIENVNSIQGRLDTAIDKLTDVSTSIKSMLAVHEEKIQRQEQVDDIIFRKIKDRDSEIDEIFRDLQREMDQVEKRLLVEIKALRNDIGGRVGVLEKYRWIILGGFIAIGWILSKNFKFIMQMMSGTGIS